MRFDWKWFVSLSLPIIVAILIPGIVGYFGLKTDVAVIKAELQETRGVITAELQGIRKDIVENREAMGENKASIQKLTTEIEALKLNQTKILGKLDLIDERLRNLKK